MTKEQEEKIKSYLKILPPHSHTELQKFIKFLDKNTDYFFAPASSNHHLAFPGGLFLHSCNVADIMLKLNEKLIYPVTDISCVKVGLFHDLGKSDCGGAPYYISEKDKDKVSYSRNKLLDPFLTVPQRSLKLLTKHIEISNREYQSILIHDGLYATGNKEYAGKECPLALIAHFADMWASHFIERGVKWGEIDFM